MASPVTTVAALSVSDIVSLSVGAVALAVTVFLTLIGLVVALEVHETKRKVEEMGAAIGLEKAQLFGLRATAMTLGRFVSDAKVAIDIQRRATENILAHLWPDEEDRAKHFRESIILPLGHLDRLQKYIEILSPHEIDHFEEDVGTLCRRFPDHETANTLEELSKILPKDEARIAAGAAKRLKRKLKLQGAPA